MYKGETLDENKSFIYGFLNLLPFFIYDPELFYPRHIIIGLCFLSLNKVPNIELSKKFKELVK